MVNPANETNSGRNLLARRYAFRRRALSGALVKAVDAEAQKKLGSFDLAQIHFGAWLRTIDERPIPFD